MKGMGLDVGTAFIVSARQADQLTLKSQRDAFLAVDGDESTKRILDMVKAQYFSHGDQIIIVGEAALSLANTFHREVRRPMFKGVISNKDELARDILCEIVKAVAGKATVDKEPCFYTVPAMPLDLSDEEFDTTYHSDIVGETLRSMGYSPRPINEALCIVYNELADNQFTGMAISFGAGMTNICLSNIGIVHKSASFSLLKGGDWIDKMVANRKAGVTASKITKIKEDQVSPIHLIKDNGSHDIIRDSICKYYRALISNALQNAFAQFKGAGVDFEKPVPIVVAGGTSCIAGFMDVFKDELSRCTLPFQPGEIIHASDPLGAVARGALIRAQLEK